MISPPFDQRRRWMISAPKSGGVALYARRAG